MDFDWDFDNSWADTKMATSPVTTGSVAPNPFVAYSDEELLSLPADFIAQSIRDTALGGREYITGDTSATTLAAVRIPDIEATTEDYHPRLTWDHYNAVDMDPPGKYAVNLTLANKAVAPRVAEPALPPSTKVTGHQLTGDDVPLPPIERALLKGAQTVQVVKKGGGDYHEVAQLLGRVWGSDAIFDPDEPVDLLGDVSLQRVLARAGKRRYETYRNIGFTSLVTAGSTHANNRNYGSSAVINWQRRTELAKLFLHTALCLESEELVEGQNFGITVRIPFESVRHHTWSDLGMSCDPSLYPPVPVSPRLAKQAEQFVRIGLRDALRVISAAVRARGDEISWGTTDVIAAGEFDRLIYKGELTATLEKTKTAYELSNEVRTTFSDHIFGTANAHDVRTATIELLSSARSSDIPTAHVFSYLSHLARLVTTYGCTDRVNLTKYALSQCPQLQQFAMFTANRPSTYSTRHKKANWSQLAITQLPRDLWIHHEITSATVIARGVVYAHLFDHSSQVHRSIEHRASRLASELNEGIRSRKQIVVHYGESVIGSVRQEILLATKRFFRERYRRRALANKTLSRYVDSPKTRLMLNLGAAYEYARADAAGRVALSIKSNAATAVLPDRRVKAILAIWASNLRREAFPELCELGPKSMDEVWAIMNKAYAERFGIAGEPTSPVTFQAAMDRFLRQHTADYIFEGIKSEEINPAPELKQGFSVNAILKAIKTDGLNRGVGVNPVDDMMSRWFMESGIAQEWDDEQLEELVTWVTKHIDEHVQDVSGYISTHSKAHTPKQARKLVEEWTDKMDDDVEGMEAMHEIC